MNELSAMGPRRGLEGVGALPMPHLCMGLSRFLGNIGYFTVAVGLFKYLAAHWGYSFEIVGEAWEAGGKGKALVLLPAFAGFLGLAIGQGIGASIKIKSDRVSMKINVLWHLFANGQIGWIALSLTLMSASLRDKSAGIAFMKQQGIQYSLSAVLVAAIGSSLVAFIMWPFVLNPLRQRDERWRVGTMLFSLLVGVSMGIAQASMWGLSIPFGAVFGFLLLLFLIPVSSSMWTKDQAKRRAQVGDSQVGLLGGVRAPSSSPPTSADQGPGTQLDSASPQHRPRTVDAHLASPELYRLDMRGKRVFDSAVALHRPFLRYSIYEDYSQGEVDQLRTAPELRRAERLYKEAIDIAVANAADVRSWEQITYLSNAIRAHLWLALLYRQRFEFEKVAANAQRALALLERLPEDVRSESEKLGLKSDAMFRLVEMDHFLGNGTTEGLLRRYEAVLAIDQATRDGGQAAEVRGRIAELHSSPLQRRHYS